MQDPVVLSPSARARRVTCYLLLLAAAAAPAAAQEAGIIDPTRPLRIVATEVVADERRAVTTYSGNVRMLQSHASLRGDRVLVHLEGSAGERYQAYGNPARVEYRRDPDAEVLIGHARQMQYDLATERLNLLQDATLDRGEDHLEGDRIAYYVPTDRALVMGAGELGRRIRAIYRPVAR